MKDVFHSKKKRNYYFTFMYNCPKWYTQGTLDVRGYIYTYLVVLIIVLTTNVFKLYKFITPKLKLTLCFVVKL